MRLKFLPPYLSRLNSLCLQNRELQIMRRLEHCNIVKLKYFFYSSGEKVSPLLFIFWVDISKIEEVNFHQDPLSDNRSASGTNLVICP